VPTLLRIAHHQGQRRSWSEVNQWNSNIALPVRYFDHHEHHIVACVITALVSFSMCAPFIFYVHPHLGVGYVSAYHVTCSSTFLCLCFHALLICINNCTTRCNTKQSIILQVHSTCFGCQPHPSSGVRKTVTTASGTGHIFCAAASLQCGQASLATAAQKIWPVSETVVTVCVLLMMGVVDTRNM